MAKTLAEFKRGLRVGDRVKVIILAKTELMLGLLLKYIQLTLRSLEKYQKSIMMNILLS